MLDQALKNIAQVSGFALQWFHNHSLQIVREPNDSILCHFCILGQGFLAPSTTRTYRFKAMVLPFFREVVNFWGRFKSQ
jgi:hypothetical protein